MRIFSPHLHLSLWISSLLLASCSQGLLERRQNPVRIPDAPHQDNSDAGAVSDEKTETPKDTPPPLESPEPYHLSYGFKSGRQLFNSYKNASLWKPSPSAIQLFNAMEESLPIKGYASDFDSTKQGNIVKLASIFCAELIGDAAARKAFFTTDYALLTPTQLTPEAKAAIARTLMEGLWGYETKAMNMVEMEKILVDLQTQVLVGNVSVAQAMAGVCIAVASSMPAVML